MGLLDEQGMADPDPEQRAPRMVCLEAGESLAHLGRGVHPEVEDAGGGDDRRCRIEERPQRAEHVATDVGDPQRGVAERLELRGGVADLGRVAVAQLAAPDADAGELHTALRNRVRVRDATRDARGSPSQRSSDAIWRQLQVDLTGRP